MKKKASPGIKYDTGKDPWDLLPWGAVREVVAVLGHGARKYGPGNWKKVPGARKRYFAAAQRHMLAWWGGEKIDPESGLSHLAHAVCCLLFLIFRDAKLPQKKVQGATPQSRSPQGPEEPAPLGVLPPNQSTEQPQQPERSRGHFRF